MRWNSVLAVPLLLCAFATPSPAVAADGSFPWKAGDTPPPVAGIALGDTEQHVRDVLGAPSSTAQMGAGTAYEYPAAGLEIVATQADGVSIIRLRTPAAGSIDGLEIGDDIADVVAKWGQPNDGQGRVALFSAGVWTVEVRLEDNGPKIVDILLAWNTTKWPDFDRGKAQYYRTQ
ncbi:MAG: hypothetical protein ABSA49_10755 [Rhizomicrobium sp.]